MWGLNKLIHTKLPALCLTYSKWSSNINYYYYFLSSSSLTCITARPVFCIVLTPCFYPCWSLQLIYLYGNPIHSSLPRSNATSSVYPFWISLARSQPSPFSTLTVTCLYLSHHTAYQFLPLINLYRCLSPPCLLIFKDRNLFLYLSFTVYSTIHDTGASSVVNYCWIVFIFFLLLLAVPVAAWNKLMEASLWS